MLEDICIGGLGIIFFFILFIVFLIIGHRNNEKSTDSQWVPEDIKESKQEILERINREKYTGDVLEMDRIRKEKAEQERLERLEHERLQKERAERERLEKLERDPEYQRKKREQEECARKQREAERQWKIEHDVPDKVFKNIVKVVKKNYNKLRLIDLFNNDNLVHGTVCSQSGITEWDFTIDFADYDYAGIMYITGECSAYYNISSDNPDSPIPETIMKIIQKYIHLYHKFQGNDEEFFELISNVPYRELDFS